MHNSMHNRVNYKKNIILTIIKTPVDRYHVIFNVNCSNVFCFFLNELSNDIKKFGI